MSSVDRRASYSINRFCVHQLSMQIKEFPFRNGGQPVPKEHKEDVAAVRSWLKHQDYLPQISEELLM
ncbi:hypothetical protein GE061_004036 [Apolygus lucorum]|uniref:Uncharacterized protein n=1 Tax=Apolygus lucorum TaxID=248454 RepID=A0A8S9WY87_APOLU|nr:hypothetical protein GE061_004036 [Apolygus lucorum]